MTSTSSTGQRNANAPGEDGGKRPPSKGRRRSRRISEMSAASAESIESSDEEDEEEVSSSRVRKKNAKKVAESEESEPVDVDEAEQTPRRRPHHRRKISETDSNSVDTKPVADLNVEGGTPSTPVRRGRRRATTAPESTLPDVAAVKKEPEDEEKVASNTSADLNTTSGNSTPRAVFPEPFVSLFLVDVSNSADTESKDVHQELKLPADISTASKIKTASPVPPASPQVADASGPVNSVANASAEPATGTCSSSSVQNVSTELAHPGISGPAASPQDSTAPAVASAYVSVNSNPPDVSTATPLAVPPVVVSATSPAAEAPESQKMGPRGGNDDDVYEFREPEPFAFEVRARRESPFSEDRVANRLTPRKSPKEEEDESNKKATPSVLFFSLKFHKLQLFRL